MKKLKNFFILSLCVFQITTFAFAETAKKKTRVENKPQVVENEVDEKSVAFSKNQLSIELLGAAILYSIFWSHRFTQNAALNIGASFYSASAGGISASIFQVPVSFSYLLGSENSFFELLGGLDLVFVSATLSDSSTSISASGTGAVPELGLGYRYWPEDGGFHFRATLYGIVASKGFVPWIGLSFGAAFAP